jgi:hypothetical protein
MVCVFVSHRACLSQTLRSVDLQENYVSQVGRLAVAAVVMPDAPAVVAALQEEQMETARFNPQV